MRWFLCRSSGGNVSAQHSGVSYTLSAFKRARFVGGGKHLLLQADQHPEVALQAMREATYAVTEALHDYEIRDEAYVVLDGPVPSPNGPIARVQDCEPAKALPLMLEHLAADLTARGITGKLVPAKEAKDRSAVARDEWPVLGMILSPLDDIDAMYDAYEDWRHHQLRKGSWVEQQRLRRVVTTLIDWMTEIQGPVLIHTTTTVEADRTGLVDYVVQALRGRPRLAISASDPDHNKRRQVRFAYSEVIVYDFDPDHPRTQQLVALTDLATTLAPDLAYALVRELGTSTRDVIYLRDVPPTIGLFNDLSFTGPVMHLEPHYVFDAGVAQVLTTSQLTKTNLPPERWHVDDLRDDRHLVTAADPDPWLHPDPHYIHRDNTTLPPDWTDPDALATARADFGHAILTLDTLRQNPPPLTADQIRADPNLRNLGVRPPAE